MNTTDISKLPAISDREFAERLQRVQAAASEHGYDMPRCRQCVQAYYCDSDYRRNHWRKHKSVCQAAVAAVARHAH